MKKREESCRNIDTKLQDCSSDCEPCGMRRPGNQTRGAATKSEPGSTSWAYHLLCDHDNSLEREAAVAVVEEVFQRRPEQVDDEDIVEAFLAEVIYIRDASCMHMSVSMAACEEGRDGQLTAADQDLVGAVLVSQLRGIALPGFLQDSDSR